jgi:hypothetical protein
LAAIASSSLGTVTPQWLPPLAEGGAPECPHRLGMRTERSEVVAAFGWTAYILGTTRRNNRGCQYDARLVVKQKWEKEFRLPNPDGNEFDIVDFSPDGNHILLTKWVEEQPPNLDYRDVEVALVSLSDGDMHWINAWDLFGWGNCDGTVEPQGFTGNGQVIVRARQSTWTSHQRPNGVTSPALFQTYLKPRGAQRLSDDTKIKRFAKEVRPAFEPCKSDPDIVGACFLVHGRLSFWNGTPTTRIWRIGTKRILGDHYDMPLPESLAVHMNSFGDEAYGDFTVCPFTKERPGAMQMVCVESAKQVVYKSYRGR